MTSFDVRFTAAPQVDVTATTDRVSVWFDDVALSVFVSQGRPLAAGGADLRGANLGGADLRGANLGGADRPSWLPDRWTVTANGYIAEAAS